MNNKDFNTLYALLSKLQSATDRAASRDHSFKRYFDERVRELNELPVHLKQLEEGLRTAKILKA